MPRHPTMTGSTLSVLVSTAMLLMLVMSAPALAQSPCGGFGAGGFNFGGGFQGGFNNFGGQFQGGFQGFQFGQGFNNFGGGSFQGGFQGGFQGFQFGGQFQGGGFNFGVGGFQGGFNNFGSGGFNISGGVGSFGFNFGGAPGCPTGVFGLIPDGATVTAGDTFQYRLVWVSPTTWQDLEHLELRLRDPAGNVAAQIRWLQGTDQFALIDPPTGRTIAQGPSRGNAVLDSPNLSVVLAQSYSDNSGQTGQAVGLNTTIIPKAPLGGRFLGVDVGAKSDGAAPTPFELAALLNVLAPAQQVQQPDSNNDDEEDARNRRKTEEQRQQAARTNRSGLDDFRTEGDAVETNCDAEWPSVTIANRDGDVVLRLIHDAKASCRLVQPGDYVEAIGEKQHEQLYDAHQLTVRRNGTRVR
jgi:hypothetical protein